MVTFLTFCLCTASNSQAALSMLFTILFFAYLQGGIVLISGTWFRYQIVSRVLLHILAESSMYALLNQCKVKTTISLSLGLLYATTFSIQYWTMRQGFSSWGAALLPFCFIPAIHYIFYQKVEPIRLALSWC